MFETGIRVSSPQFGKGVVELPRKETSIVRFEHGLEECLNTELASLDSIDSKIEEGIFDNSLEVLNRSQALCIKSTNDRWGVFSRSRIALLPHQLWVCKQVNSSWPTRWLIADDVGLGKTIEAGLILWPLIASKKIDRLLVICPAKLVDQWHQRMLKMFDIKLYPYMPEADTDQRDFWALHQHVVASMHTLRLDQEGRHDRLLASAPWDMVIVDEAHHLNASESSTTKGFRLLRALEDASKIKSMLFFTGTPHRGKDYGFFSLLSLLRPDRFDPKRPFETQLRRLPDVMIRNNKASVTDIDGNRLFTPPAVDSEVYEFSENESCFYERMTNFILDGRAYASGLDDTNGRAVMLVLTSMQKLASSSFAAIRAALANRVNRVGKTRGELGKLQNRLMEAQQLGDDDSVPELESQILEASRNLLLMENEEPRLNELLQLLDRITTESKISKIIELLRSRFEGRSVLLFTEYKATQSAVMSAIMEEFGPDSVTFINGDNEILVSRPDGHADHLKSNRVEVAKRFNSGQVRFLVSTEAAGEGIDLQHNCFSLIHIDLPWNPMRLHQRVGRLYRYGQDKRVEVLSLRNLDTVESLIWEKLVNKLAAINLAFHEAMAEPEDMFQLVLGMTQPSVFNELFSEGATLSKESVSNWFDEKSKKFAGENAMDVVTKLVGNSSRFDYGASKDDLPRVGLGDLRPFFELALQLNGRRPKIDNERMSFLTPKSWREGPGVFADYDDMHFDRSLGKGEKPENLMGVGHNLVDRALTQAVERESQVGFFPDLKGNKVIVFKVFDKVTGERVQNPVVVGVHIDASGNSHLKQDWSLLLMLNDLRHQKKRESDPSPAKSIAPSLIENARCFAETECRLLSNQFLFQSPVFELVSVLIGVD